MEQTPPPGSGRKPSSGIWIVAAVEIAVAVAVGTLLVHYGSAPSADTHSMSDMPGMPVHHQAPQVHWTLVTVGVAVCTVAMLVWWVASRAKVPSVLAAVGLICVVTCEPVRVMSLQSHVVAMAALESLLVATPLLVISAFRRERSPDVVRRSGFWTSGVVIAVALNSAFLIALHAPAVHNAGATVAAVPLWLTGVAVIVGFGFWAAILLTERHVDMNLRGNALIVGQEVAVILGLAALFVPSPYMHHANPLGLSPSTDQRLGGSLMVLTCAAVSLPLIRRLQQQRTGQPLRTEFHVH